ncbi:hypothetical protein [Bacillus phage PK2]|nr:hypothetical protein [Bacillus phage PK2]
MTNSSKLTREKLQQSRKRKLSIRNVEQTGQSQIANTEGASAPSFQNKTKGEVKMEFYRNDYGEEMQKDQFMSLQSLIKNNDGLFKSEKQGKFIHWKWTLDDEFVKDSWVSEYIDVREGHKYISIDGFLSFSHGKGKGHRRLSYTYEIDHAGITRRFRSRYTYDGGWSGLKSVECDWERTVETPEPPKAPEKAPEAPKPVSEYVGSVGERINALELSVTFVKQFESEWGISTLHKFTDDAGNVFAWFSSSKTLELGNKYRMNATVKKHEEFREEKQTVLTRCMKIEEVS